MTGAFAWAAVRATSLAGRDVHRRGLPGPELGRGQQLDDRGRGERTYVRLLTVADLKALAPYGTGSSEGATCRGRARAAIIAKGAAITGIRAALPRLPETIPASPALVLGQMTWETTPGDRERTTYVFDLVLFVERTSDDDRVIADTDDLIDLVQAAYVSGITIGQTAQTTQCVIRGGASNEWGKVGGAEYLLTTFRLELAASRQRGYTA